MKQETIVCVLYWTTKSYIYIYIYIYIWFSSSIFCSGQICVRRILRLENHHISVSQTDIMSSHMWCKCMRWEEKIPSSLGLRCPFSKPTAITSCVCKVWKKVAFGWDEDPICWYCSVLITSFCGPATRQQNWCDVNFSPESRIRIWALLPWSDPIMPRIDVEVFQSNRLGPTTDIIKNHNICWPGSIFYRISNTKQLLNHLCTNLMLKRKCTQTCRGCRHTVHLITAMATWRGGFNEAGQHHKFAVSPPTPQKM